MTLYLDIETTSLKADTGIIVAAGILDSKEGEIEVKFASGLEEEKELLLWLRERLEGESTIFTWNGLKFTVPFIITRALAHGMDFSWLRRMNVMDLMTCCMNFLLLSEYKLDSVADFLGVKVGESYKSKETGMFYWKALRGDKKARETIVQHCEEDLRKIRGIHERIKYLVAARAGRKKE